MHEAMVQWRFLLGVLLAVTHNFGHPATREKARLLSYLLCEANESSPSTGSRGACSITYSARACEGIPAR